LYKLLQPFYGTLDFVQDKPGEPVPEETFIHSHLSWSSIIPYLLPPSTMIHKFRGTYSEKQFSFLFNLLLESLFAPPISRLLVWNHPLHAPHISSPNHCFFSQHTTIRSQPVLP